MKLYEILEKQLEKEPNYVTDSRELKKWRLINKAQNYDEKYIGLLLDNKDLKVKLFPNYNVDLLKQEQYIEEFKCLSLAEQEQHLVELLDKNRLYLNLSSQYDSYFECSTEEKKVTQDFYQLKK
jgi:adenine-specific DNA-methyltransferase